MQFLDELDSESRVLDRLGAEGEIYDEGYGAEIVGSEDDGLLEFDEAEAPTAALRVVGARPPQIGPSEAAHRGLAPDDDSMHELVSTGSDDALPAASGDDWEEDDDSYGDDYDEFEDDPLPTGRVRPGGLRLQPDERPEAVDTDPSWSLQDLDSSPPRPDRPGHSSWLDELPVVRSRVDADDVGATSRDEGPSWSAPLLSFDSGERGGGWRQESSDEEQVIAAGDEFSLEEVLEEDDLDDTHLPTATFGMPEDDELDDDRGDSGGRYFGGVSQTRRPGADESAGDTGNWNRLDILASVREGSDSSDASPFGVAPKPVWRASGSSPSGDASWEDTDDPFGTSDDAPDDGGWPSSPLWSSPDEVVGPQETSTGRVVPPVMPMQSGLKSEIDSRSPLEPKAVVLKTLDGVQRPELAFDEPSEVRSRVPPEQVAPAGRVSASAAPVPVESSGGSGRMWLIVAVAVLITVGAVVQWRSTMFSEPAPVALDTPVVKAAPPAQLAQPDTPSPSAGDADATAPPPVAAPSEPVPAEATASSEPPPAVEAPEKTDAREERRASRMDAIDIGRLLVTSDVAATVYVDGKRVGSAPMAVPGIELRPGHYDIKVVPRRGRTYRTDTRVDAGRVRNIDVKFRK